MGYKKYRACFTSEPFSVPVPFDCNIGKSGSPPGNTIANNEHFQNYYYQQSAGHQIVPGDFIRLYSTPYPQFWTCFEYIGDFATPEAIHVEYLGGHSLQNSGWFIEPYGDCDACETQPSVFGLNHSWRYCDNSLAFNPVPVVPTPGAPPLGSCFLPNTDTNNQAFHNQLTAAIGPISQGDVIQLSDGTCMYYEGDSPRPTSYDIDVSNNPGSGDWHTGYVGGQCGNTFGTPPTRGLLGSVVDCQQCPIITITTTGIQPLTTTTTTVAPITTTTTTCYNCCTTTTTGDPCVTCGIESCCVGTGVPVQYGATGNLLLLLNSLNCDDNYAFQIPNLLVSGGIVQNECWKPLCNPIVGIPVANMVETQSDLTSNGLINMLGCNALSIALISANGIPCCPGQTTTSTTLPGQTTTTTTSTPTTTTTTGPLTTTTTTVWYECITPPLATITNGSSCDSLTLKPHASISIIGACEYLMDEQINGNIPINVTWGSFYHETGTPPNTLANQCVSVPSTNPYAQGGMGYSKATHIITNAANVLYVGSGAINNWQSFIDYLNSITPGVFTYIDSRFTVVMLIQQESNNMSESWNTYGGPCTCNQPPCFCQPCFTPGVTPCIFNDFSICDIAANAIPCCQPVTTTSTTPGPTTTTTTTLAIGVELCCPPYDQYIIPSGNFLYSLIQGLSIGSAHIFELTLPDGSVIQTCAEVINNPSPINVINNGFLWLSPTTDMGCIDFNIAIVAGTYYFPGMELGCCPPDDWHECITPPPLVPGIDANWCGDQFPTTYVIPAGINGGNTPYQNRVEAVNHITQNFGAAALYMFYHYINPTATLSLAGCENLSLLYSGLGRHEKVGEIQLSNANISYVFSGQTTTLSTWAMLITILNGINQTNGWAQDFVTSDTWDQVIVRMTNNAAGDTLLINVVECGCFNPCFCQPCVPPALNCVYSSYVLCDVAAQGNPCCLPVTTTTTTIICDRLGLEDCCSPYNQYTVTLGSPLYVIIANAAYTPGQTVLALTVSDPAGVVFTSCFKIIDTSCPSWVILTGGFTTPPLPPADWTTGQPNCVTCLSWIAQSPWYFQCSVTTTTTQWWECVSSLTPVPGVDAIGCDSSDTELTPPGITTVNGQYTNNQIYTDYLVATYGTSEIFDNYFFINPSIVVGQSYICENTGSLYNGDGYYYKINGFVSSASNGSYFLSGPVTINAHWEMLIDALNVINTTNSWPQDFLYSDHWSQVIGKMHNNAPNDMLSWAGRLCLCTVNCFCQPCSSGPNCIYQYEPDCLVSANATPCCETTTYSPPTTTTTTSALVGLKLCCDPYTEYEVIYNSSLYNLIDYSLPPFTRAFVMTITLPNGTDLTACMEMDMNIPLSSPQVQTGQFEWLFSPTVYSNDCTDLNGNTQLYNGYGFPDLLNGCCPATTTTTSSSLLGLEECCYPFTQYVVTGNLLAFIQSYNIGQAFYGSLSSASVTTPNLCWNIITNPSGLIVDTAVGYSMQNDCIELDAFLGNNNLGTCCPTTTTTTSPTTTTTTTALCDSCGVLFVDGSNPPGIYNYNHTTNQTNLLFTATQNLGYSADIARYGNLIWVYYSIKIQEYIIDPVTCNVTWNREITTPAQIGNGLTAIDSTTLIGGSSWNATPCMGDICSIDITTNTAVLSSSIALTGSDVVQGDILYLAGSNTLIVALATSTGSELAYYDLNTGVLLGTVNMGGVVTFGLYCYNQNIYGVTQDKDIYPIYVTSSSISAGSSLQTVPNPPLWVWGAASDPDCCLGNTTTTTSVAVVLGIRMCCAPYKHYTATGSLLTYIQGLNVGDTFAGTFNIPVVGDKILCVEVIGNATTLVNVNSFVTICNPSPHSCSQLSAHLISYNPPGHGYTELAEGCCPGTTTTTTEPVSSNLLIRACCPKLGTLYYQEYKPTTGSNLENLLTSFVVGTVIELILLPVGGSALQSQCYQVIPTSMSYLDTDGYTTLNQTFANCTECNAGLLVPIPASCQSLPF